MENRKKVLVLASWYPSRAKPFLGTFVQRQTEAAAKYVQMSALFVCADSGLNKKFDIESKTINNVFTVNVYYNKEGNFFQKSRRFFKAHLLGWKYIVSHWGKPDMIHLNILWPAGIFAYYLKLFSGLKYIITENWTGYLDSNGSYRKSSAMKRFFIKTISRGAEMIMPVSIDLANAMKKQGLGSTFEVIYNVADTSVFYPAAVSNKGNKTAFLHVSTTLDEQKNVSGILSAVKMLSVRQNGRTPSFSGEKRNNFELKIISEANFSAHEKRAEELGILNKFVFFGSARNAQGVAEEMRKADCFVLFSNYENLPVVILEAMASGLPVISSTAGGVQEHISNEFGLLVKPKDVNALCSAMEYMIDNKNNYDSQKIRDYAVKNFSYDSVGKRFEDVYRKVIYGQ